MPKKKRLKHRKKKEEDEYVNEDLQIRSYIEDTSINIDSIDINELNKDVRLNANVTQLPMLDSSYTVNSTLNYSGLKCLFSSRNGCHSSSLIEASNIIQTPHINKNDPSNEESISCSRSFDKGRLEHLQNFNNVLLNTSQNVSHKSEVDECGLDNSMDLVFKLSNCKMTSTPIAKRDVENLKSFDVQKNFCKKSASCSVNRRRSYRTSPMVLFYCQPPQVQHRQRRSMSETSCDRKGVFSIAYSKDMCAWMLSKIKNYHTQYLSHLPTKFVNLCTWSGIVANQGLAFLYQLCSKLGASPETEQGYKEVIKELHAVRRDILELREDMKRYFAENKESCATTRSFGPPPPPPPLPPPLPPPAPSLPNIPFARKTQQKQKIKEDATKPIISLDEILKVKLKKVQDRPLSIRRATEPVVIPSLRSNLKSTMTGETPKSTIDSTISNSPCSSLTRILRNVTTHTTPRVKRLKLPRANSFNHFSRKEIQFKRERSYAVGIDGSVM